MRCAVNCQYIILTWNIHAVVFINFIGKFAVEKDTDDIDA